MTGYKFGAVYVLEQDYTDEEIVRDLTNMKECGYNLITLWPVANAWLAKSSHEFVFTDTIKVLDICHKLGMKAILQLFGQNQAQEFMPDSALIPEMEDHDELGGHVYENAFWSNLNHPMVKEYFNKYFGCAMSALKDHPAVYGWDVFNEAHFRTDDPWTTALYQQWLEKKYKTIEILNHDWYRRYEAFSQIRPEKRRAAYSIWSSLLPAIDYEKFRSENLTDICRFLYNTAKQYDTVHPIIIDGTSAMIIQPTTVMRNNDEFETAYVPDVYGATFYPKSWGRNYKDTPWTLSMYFAIPAGAARKAGKPYAINELQTHTQSALTPGSEVTPKELRNWIWMNLFNAPEMMQLWRWRPFLHGYQVTGRGLTQMDGTPNARSEEVKALLEIVNSNSQLFSDFQIKKPSVRIGMSYAGRLAFDSLLKWKGSFWADDVEGWYRLFWDFGLPAEFTNLEKLDAQDFSCPVIVLPSAVQLSKEETDALVRYVNNGGLLIADCRMGTLNEKAVAPSEGIPGKVLSQLFGLRELDVTSGESFILDGQKIPTNIMSQKLEIFDNAQVLATMEDGSPSLVSHIYGKGQTLYFNSFAGVSLKEKVWSQVKKLVASFLKDKQLMIGEKGDKTHLAFIESDTHNGLLVINFAETESEVVLNGFSSTCILENLMNGEQVTVQEGTAKFKIAGDTCHVYTWIK